MHLPQSRGWSHPCNDGHALQRVEGPAQNLLSGGKGTLQGFCTPVCKVLTLSSEQWGPAGQHGRAALLAMDAAGRRQGGSF